MDLLLKGLGSLNTATPQSVQLLLTLFSEAQFKKGWLVCNPLLQTKPMLYYLSKGLLKGTTVYNRQIMTLWMMQEGFFISGNGFLFKSSINETIVCEKDSTIFTLNLRKAEKLAVKNHGLYSMLIEIYERGLSESRTRELMLRLKTAGERKAFFQQHNAQLFDRLTTEQVAEVINVNRKYMYSIGK